MKNKFVSLAVKVNILIVTITLAISLSLVAISDSSYRKTILDPYKQRLAEAEIDAGDLAPYMEYFMPYFGTEELRQVKEGADVGKDHLSEWLEEKPYSNTLGHTPGATMYSDWLEVDLFLYRMLESCSFDEACAELVKDDAVYRISRCDRRTRSYSSNEDFGLEASFVDMPAESFADPSILEVDDTIYLIRCEQFELDGGEGRVWLSYDMTEAISEHRTLVLNSILCVLALTVAASLISAGLLRRHVTRPIRMLAQAATEFAPEEDGSYSPDGISQVNIPDRNELGDLSREIRSMQARIVENTENLSRMTAEKERINTELNLATQIQEGVLPSVFPPFPDRHEFDLFASMTPAREVGGDFYDFFLVDDDHLCMVMADVSGKGIPASLFMMAARIILKHTAILGKYPAEILKETNAAICDNNREEMFLTVWLGILEISTGTLTAANAGHEYPAVMQNGRFSLYRDNHGFVVGGMESTHYKEYELHLEKGDKLFLYTDGVPEAMNSRGEMFGTDRMIDALNESAGGSCREILTGMQKAVSGFAGDAEQFDDLTMLCMEYRG